MFVFFNMDKVDMVSFLKTELEKIRNKGTDLAGGCVACQIMFSLKQKTGISEQDCADVISDILSTNPQLNEVFIQTVEQVHMVERNIAKIFTSKQRDSKDAYLEAYFVNVLDELAAEANQFSHKILVRKLLLAYICLYIAQTLGIDYHAATEELYYLLRKNKAKEIQLDEFISKFEQKIKQNHF